MTYVAEPFGWLWLAVVSVVRLGVLMLLWGVAGPLALLSHLAGSYFEVREPARLHDAVLDAVEAVDDRLGAVASAPLDWLWAKRR